MKLEVFKSSYGYYNFRTVDGKPTEEMSEYLKTNGYRWSRNNNCWYPATAEAKEANLHDNFVLKFQEKFFPADVDQVKTEKLDSQSIDERITYLENLITELQEAHKQDLEKIRILENQLTNHEETIVDYYTQQEQSQLDEEAEWEKENSLTTEEEKEIIENQKNNVNVTPEPTESLDINPKELFEAAERIAREEEPEAERVFSENISENKDVEVTPDELSIAKAVLPTTQYVSTLSYSQGEEGNFFKQKIKDVAAAVLKAPKIGGTDNMEQHPIVLRYFHPTGTETLVTEIGKDGEAYGFQCLKGDYKMAEWGDIDLNEVKNIPGMELDYHIEEGMTVERWLYKEEPDMFPKYARFAGVEEKAQEPLATEKTPFDVAQESGNDIEAIAGALNKNNPLFADLTDEEKNEKNEFVPKPVSLETILAVMDMRPEMTADGKILVFDEQRKEYIDNGEDFEGNGQKAWEFSDAAEIFERLDIFIKEAFIDDMEDQLNAVGIKYTEDGHARSLEECCELYKKEIENGNTQLSEGDLNLAFGIVNPETVILPEQIQARDELLSHVKYFVTEFAEFPSYDDTENISLEDAVKAVRERNQQEHNFTTFGTNARFTVGIEIDGEKFGNDGASYNPETGDFETFMFEANSLFRKYGGVALEELAEEIKRQNNGLPPAMRLPCNFNPADFGLEEKEEILIEAENGQMMTPDELRKWKEEQEMQHGQDSEFDEMKEGKTFALEAAKEMNSEQKKLNFVLDKLSAAGIEVVQDKAEFYRILESEKVLQKMTEDYSEFEKLSEELNIQKSKSLELEDKKKSLEDRKIEAEKQKLEDLALFAEKISKYLPVEENPYNKRTYYRGADEIKNKILVVDNGNYSWYLANIEGHMAFVHNDNTSEAQITEIRDYDEIKRFTGITSIFSETIIEELQNNLKTFLEQKITLEKQKQNRLLNDVGKIKTDLLKASIENKTLESDFARLDNSLRFNANFEIYSVELSDEVSIFPGSTGKSGLGIRHIIEERAKKDGLSTDEITALCGLILDTVRSGKISRDSDSRCELSKNGIIAIIRKDFDNIPKNWVLTGFHYTGKDEEKNREATETIKTVIAKYSNSDGYSYFRSQVGAVIASLDSNITQTTNKSRLQTMVQNNQTYGFAHEGKIYLNPEIMDSESAVHEYTHLWDAYTQKTNPELWQKGKDIFKNTHFWNDVKSNPNYADIADNDDLLLSEVHARICGKMAEAVLSRILEKDGELTKDTVINWDKEVDAYIYETFESSRTLSDGRVIQSKGYGAFGTVIDINAIRSWFAQPMKDLMNGVHITKNISVEPEQKQPVSKKDIKAIREQCRQILQKPDSEITESDKAILAQYEGAGGLNEDNRTNAGILNEFYTPNNLVDKVWQIVDAYAPKAKTVLEPSAGVGKFANNRPNNEFTMHELDETSARINKILHPEAKIIQGAYQKQFFDAGERFKLVGFVQPKYDVVIGNPPYGTYNDKYKGLGEGKEFDRYEEYFIAKGLDALKDENAIMAFVVPSGFLTSSKDKVKQLIAEKGELIDAYRLPVGTFPTTKVGTDIIIMRSWDKKLKEFLELEKKSQEKPETFKEDAVKLLETAKDDMAKVISINNYFSIHPEKILGEVKTRSNRFGKEEEYVTVHEGLTIQDELNKIDSMLPKTPNLGLDNIHGDLKNEDHHLTENTKNSTKIEAQDISTEKPAEKTSAEKNRFSRPKKEKWNIAKSKGEVMTAEEFSRLYGRDFDEREFPIWRATDWQGNINLESLSAEDLKYMHESGRYVQKNAGEWTHKVLFTSGNIYEKIEIQKMLRISEINRNGENSEMAKVFEKNIELLELSKKTPLDIEHIHFGLKTTLAEDFTITHFDEDGNPVELNLQESFILWAQNATLATQRWRKDIDYATSNISREELGEELTFYDIVDYIDGKSVKAEAVRGWRTWDMSDEEKAAEKAERKKEADLKRQTRADTANRLFDRYLHEGLDENTKKRLEAEYNRRFNSYISPDYSKLPLFVDGMSAYKGNSKFKLYDQQIKGISFLCNKGNGLLAYDVGVGKTAAGIVATVNQIQTERSKRPLIIVPNQVYAKWYTDIKQLFPNVQVNDLYNFNKKSVEGYVDKKNPHKLNIPENSISLCTYEALKNITFTDESCENALYQDFANLLSADFDGSDKENATSSDKIKGIIGSASHVKDSSYYFFEECGFDNLTVDEAHHFKNLWVVPKPKNKGDSNEYSGIPSGKPSARALKMYGMAQLVQRNNDNRNVFMLTATPFTNSPTEVYSMLSYIGRERLHEAGISSLRSFFDEFAQTRQELGVNAKGEIDTKQVMKSWKELPALQSILTEFIDKVDGEEAEIIRPNKSTHVKQLDMSELQKQMREIDEERMAEVKEGNSAAVIVAMNNMRLSCVAPALANPAMYPGVDLPPLSQLVETSPKLKFVCDAIIDMYKDNPEKGQFMYVPLGKESHGIIKDYLVAHGIPKEAVEIINGEINSTTEKKEKISGRFNDEKDKVKILIGGQNTTEGIDLNGNSFVMYNCSLGWNPSETIQAEGRIWRQGNLQGHVHIVYPVMNDSIDSVLYQKHDEKRSRINELWNYKGDSLNIEDINPEDLKLDLIKDPVKKSKLILQEETKEARLELSKINLKIKSFDEIIEKRKQLSFDFDDSEKNIQKYERQINEYKENGLEVPEWIKSTLKGYKKDFEKASNQKLSVEKKLASWNCNTPEEEDAYIHNLNNEKHFYEEKIQHIEDGLPEILKKLEVERLEQKIMEYPVDKQREILEADILNNLRPMSEVKHEIKTKRHENMLAEKLKAGEISQEEHDLYKSAGYEKYEKWLNGEIESLEDGSETHIANQEVPDKESDRQLSVENDTADIIDKKAQETIPAKQPQMENDPYNGLDLFTSMGISEDEMFVHSAEQLYFNFDKDDIYLTPEQLTKAEQRRDEIILPVLKGKETGMYKAFNSFAKHGVFDVLGTKIDMEDTPKGPAISADGWNQLHAAMNIYRDKSFETMRYVFVDRKSGEIKNQFAISSKMPNYCLITESYDNGNETIKELIMKAEETDSLIVAVHNHPSGNVTESMEDIKVTETLNKSFTRSDGLCRFGGHIILDHDNFNLWTPYTKTLKETKGWVTITDWERFGKKDELINENFNFPREDIGSTDKLFNVAKKINDTNSWNDDFIPVIFSNADAKICALQFYDKSFFDKDPQFIRNKLQFSGIESGAIRAFPVVTEACMNKLSGIDAHLLEEKMKNLVAHSAFSDAVLPDSTIVKKYNVTPGINLFCPDDFRNKKPDVQATWDRQIMNPTLFEQLQNGTLRIIVPEEKAKIKEQTKLKKASGMDY